MGLGVKYRQIVETGEGLVEIHVFYLGFAWTMLSMGGIMYLAHLAPLLIVFALIGLELGVAVLQAYVFTILLCIYLNDAINLH